MTQRLQIYNLSKTVARLRASKQTLMDKMAENANRGEVSAIVQDLNSAFEKGLLSGISKILHFISNVVKNFSRKSSRYDKFRKQTFSCVRIIGSPRAAPFFRVIWMVLLTILKGERNASTSSDIALRSYLIVYLSTLQEFTPTSKIRKKLWGTFSWKLLKTRL